MVGWVEMAGRAPGTPPKGERIKVGPEDPAAACNQNLSLQVVFLRENFLFHGRLLQGREVYQNANQVPIRESLKIPRAGPDSSRTYHLLRCAPVSRR